MVKVTDIHSLSDFQRNTKMHLERLKESGRPEVLTVNGEAMVIIQDAASYERMADLAERAETIEKIADGIKSMQNGGGKPLAKVVESLRAKHSFLNKE